MIMLHNLLKLLYKHMHTRVVAFRIDTRRWKQQNEDMERDIRKKTTKIIHETLTTESPPTSM